MHGYAFVKDNKSQPATALPGRAAVVGARLSSEQAVDLAFLRIWDGENAGTPEFDEPWEGHRGSDLRPKHGPVLVEQRLGCYHREHRDFVRPWGVRRDGQ